MEPFAGAFLCGGRWALGLHVQVLFLAVVSAEKARNKLDLSCDLYIWAPLTGACLLLLVALLVTIVVCQKSRRRRCRCKRPMNGNSGKPSMPNRYV